jgi:hypothetical protein
MYCPTCGNEITVELKYCNRCGANLTQTLQPNPVMVPVPVKLTLPMLITGLTIVIGLAIIFGGSGDLAVRGMHPAAVTWIVLFGMATLFGCTALLIRFLSRMMLLQKESRELLSKQSPPPQLQPPPQNFATPLPPRFERPGSVTEHTTRTFSPIYKDPEPR